LRLEPEVQIDAQRRAHVGLVGEGGTVEGGQERLEPRPHDALARQLA
jgi:hypothetical protein